jgi:hypothetical protein
LKIPAAVIGLGKIGLTYDLDETRQLKANQVMTHCRSVSNSDLFKLEYSIDLNPEAVQTAVSLYGGSGYQSLGEALSQESPQLIILSVPTEFHLATLLCIAKVWQPSVYLIEKPFGKNSQEARQMANLIEAQNVNVYVNYMRRYLPNFLLLKSATSFKERGQLKSVRINGYGSLRNIFSHFLDIILFLESSSILGITKKQEIVSSFGFIGFKDPITGIQFELNGVGNSLRDCEMNLTYEYVRINVSSNGRCIGIYNPNGNLLQVFDLKESEFNSYQSNVLKEIAHNYNSDNHTTCAEDAILIHRFIESI